MMRKEVRAFLTDFLAANDAELVELGAGDSVKLKGQTVLTIQYDRLENLKPIGGQPFAYHAAASSVQDVRGAFQAAYANQFKTLVLYCAADPVYTNNVIEVEFSNKSRLAFKQRDENGWLPTKKSMARKGKKVKQR